MQEKSGVKTALIVLASALLLVCMLVLVSLLFDNETRQNAITLPDRLPAEPSQPQPGTEQNAFVTVQTENVQSVLATLTEAEHYQQTLELMTNWQDGSASRTAEILHSGSLTRITVHSEQYDRCFLTDGTSAYFWYDGEETAVYLPNDRIASVWSLAGLPDLQADLSIGTIRDAAFLPGNETSGNQIYLRCQLPGDMERQYWIDIATALPVRVDFLENQLLTTQFLQRSMELLTPDDARLSFLLPDGSEPFAH